MSTETATTASRDARRDDPAAAAAPADRRHLPEIDGLRGLAIAVIAVYHVWFNRVSGGVDVFLLLSGLLITLSLLRGVESGRGLAPVRYSARIVRRIFPPALAVAACCVLLTALWLPPSKWTESIGDIAASALYVGNWRLAEQSVDYLSSNNGASIVQHYWSLGIQAQFYLLWPLLIAACAWIARRVGWSLRRTAATAFAAVLATSFAYAVWAVGTDQAYAYFDTRARMWQFALGGLLALSLPLIATRLGGSRPAHRAGAAVLGWAAVAALLACGMAVDSTAFPAWGALVPVAAASAIVAVAYAQPGTGPGRLLTWGPLRRLGDLSYALYLWHWPVLICYLAVSGRESASLAGGLAVIAVSVALAVATRWAIEIRLPATGIGQRTARGAYALGAACLALVAAASLALYGYVAYERHRLSELVADGALYPGAGALAVSRDLEEAAFVPTTIDAAADRLPELSDECNQSMTGYEVIRCDFGDEDAETTVVMYGGSKIWHWFPAMEAVADEHGWHLVTFIKNACIIETGQAARGEERYVSCDAWNDAVVDAIAALRPDLVFTYGSRVGYEAYETFPDYTDRYEQLLATGAAVVAVRDTPSPRFDIPACVDLDGADGCAVDRASYYSEQDGFADLPVPDGVHKADLTDYICGSERCEAVVGNILVYRDDAHLTATYSRTLAPYLERELLDALDG
jgi:peptidoglycan/LPS O-acetylase OafA/YrhL